MTPNEIIKSNREQIESHNHDHFWIEDGVLYESYKTIRGLRYMEIRKVPGMPDSDKLSDEAINYIILEYFDV